MRSQQERVYRTLWGVCVMIGLLGMASISWGQWTEKASMPTARAWSSASVVDGKIYVIGGNGAESEGWPSFSTVEEYDPATDTWTTKTPMPTARQSHSASVVDGKIYVMGGSISDPWEGLSIVEEYDPATDIWTEKAPMPTGRDMLSASVVDGKIYATGGISFYGKPNRIRFSTVEEYDPATDTWTQKADMLTYRFGHSASTVNGRIYVIGGAAGQTPTSPGAQTSSVEEYDPATDTWTSKTPMPTTRAGLATCVAEGKIYAMGGNQTLALIPLLAVEVYDPATDTWTEKSPMLTPRGGLSSSVVNGKIYAIGGQDQSLNPFSTVEEYALETSIEALFWGALKATFR